MRLLSTAQHNRHDIGSSQGTGKEQKDLYVAFVDQTEYLDSISRGGLLQILRSIGRPCPVWRIIRSFHELMVTRFLDQIAPKTASNITSSVRNFVHLWGWPITVSQGRVLGIAGRRSPNNKWYTRMCTVKIWSNAACPTTHGRPPRQSVPPGVVHATPVYEIMKRSSATPWGRRVWDGKLSSLLCVVPAADSVCHWSACIVATEHMYATGRGRDPSYRRLTPYTF